MSFADLIPVQYRLLAAVGIALALLLAGSAAGWLVNGWRLGGQIAAIQRKNAEQLAKNEQVASAAFREQQQARQQLENKLSLLDQQRYGELQNAQATTDRLSADLADARQRMRVTITASSCQQLSGAGKAAGADRVDDGAVTADIQPATAADLASLAGEADACAVKLTALQGWARDVTRGD